MTTNKDNINKDDQTQRQPKTKMTKKKDNKRLRIP